MDLPALAERLTSLLAGHTGGLVAAYLFGSFARGEARSTSDVDVAVLYADRPDSTLDAQPFGLAADLSIALGRSVDVVVLNDAPADLVHRVLRDGKLLLETNPSARIAFEVKARNTYFDMLPIWRRYRKQPEAH